MLAILPCLLALAGCDGVAGPLALTSDRNRAALAPDFTTTAYYRTDSNTADILLTDLPTRRLSDPSDSLADLSGSLVHIHLFLTPKAGRTPIDASACDATLREIVLARGTAGMYGGAGFVLPGTTLMGSSFSGSIRRANLRLLRAAPGFVDRLGDCTLSGRFSAPEDEPMARALHERFDALAQSLPAVK